MLTLQKTELAQVNDPAGILTTVCEGAPAQAAFTLATVGDAKAVLQAAVTQFAHVALGIPLGMPAFSHAVARLDGNSPAQGS